MTKKHSFVRMNAGKMLKRLIWILLLTCSVWAAQAQTSHFIYIQSDNKQPFYIKLNNKVQSSSSYGYIILSKLPQGKVNFVVGFPKDEFPEQTFSCIIDKDKDKGYLLKMFEGKGWALYDLQELNFTYASNVTTVSADIPAAIITPQLAKVDTALVVDTTVVVAPAATPPAVTVAAAPAKAASKDAFGDILVAVTNDPSLKDIQGKKAVAKPVVVEKAATLVDTVTPVVTIERSSVEKIEQQKAGDSVKMVYTDKLPDGSVDTVHVLLPASKEETKPVEAVVVAAAPVQAAADSAHKAVEEAPKKEVAEVPVTETAATAKDSASNYVVPVFKQGQGNVTGAPLTATSGNGVAMVNSDCKKVASDDDFMKLRKKMAAEEDTDKMIEAAKKTFKKSCFTTEQVRNLSFLFLNDDGKYKFLDASYPYVSDSGNFKDLQSVLTNSYFINRFKAMIQH